MVNTLKSCKEISIPLLNTKTFLKNFSTNILLIESFIHMQIFRSRQNFSKWIKDQLQYVQCVFFYNLKDLSAQVRLIQDI